MRRIALALIAAAMVTTAPAMAAAPCKDAKGKFVKCPTATATPAAKLAPKKAPKKAVTKSTGHCRNAKGQFAKCGTPGAKPA